MRGRNVRRLLAIVLLGAAGIVTVNALAAHSSQRPRARLADYFTREDIERSRLYRGTRYALSLGGLAAGLALGAAIGLGPGSRWLGRWSSSASGGRWALQALILATTVTLVVSALQLPFGIGRHFHDRHWGLATQSLAGYLGDVAKGTGFQLGIAAVTALGFFGIVRALPRTWPAAAAGFGIALTVALVYLLPVVYEPLFNRFRPVEGPVRDRVLALARRAGVTVDDVLVADASRRTTRLNAYVSGLGRTKRVVLYDTLLERSSEREVDLVVAHELAHVAHRDVIKGTVLGCAGAVLAVLLIWPLVSWGALRSWVGAAAPGDPRLLPFLAFVLAWASFLALPATNLFSRSIEAAADRAAIATTGDADTAIGVEVALARANLADLQPNGFIRWMFFTHPPVLERIQIALEAKAST